MTLDSEHARVTAAKSAPMIVSGNRARAHSIGAFAAGALATGAVAFGAVAIGRLAVGALALRRGHVTTLVVDDLTVGRLRIRELIRE
jgi:hypothetical protein